MNVSTRIFAALIAAATAVAVPALALAQSAAPAPSYAQPQPSYSSPEDVVHGQIVAFDGGFNLQVRDEHGFVDTIALHQGTIINPTGLRLTPGMTVTVHGVNHGRELDANEIDTPYTTYGAVPVYPYPVAVAPYYAYPYGLYPAYGYGFGYGYPAFSVGIGFGIGPRYGHGVIFRGHFR
jgi:hypothetical protein